MSYVIAVDVGGTDIKSGLVNSNLEIIATITVPTPKLDSTGIETLKAISAIIREYQSLQKIQAVGLAVPGTLDEANGTSRWSGNLMWRNLPIRKLLENEIKIPVAFGHDVRTAALAEIQSGAAKNSKNAIFIPIGTGIAAALFIDGKIRSIEGYAGEIGHINVDVKYKCVCGKTGCLETVSSTLAISKAFEIQSGISGKSTEDIFELVLEGDKNATAVWQDATRGLARVSELLVTILAPEIIVYGGGLSNAGETLLKPLREYLDSSLTFQRMPKLKLAHFGSKAGIIGCAILAFEHLNTGS